VDASVSQSGSQCSEGVVTIRACVLAYSNLQVIQFSDGDAASRLQSVSKGASVCGGISQSVLRGSHTIMMRVLAYSNLQVIQFSDGDSASRLQSVSQGASPSRTSACVCSS
jgi:hypothetical protein